MDVSLIELVLAEMSEAMRKGDAEIEHMIAEIERMNAEIERIRRNKAELTAVTASLNALLNGKTGASSSETVAELAYRYWAERGYSDGHHEEDWLRAEQELRAKACASPVGAELGVAC